ncbi:MAG: GerMN domain-containing protein [Clostridia bacterium]|nr:GerMN domain-containing protein [Clostridia bacterium]
MRRRRLLALTLAMMLGLSGCAARPVGEDEEKPAPTLPRASVEWTAPDGDFIYGEPGLWTLYLPSRNGLNLAAQHVQSTPGILRSEEAEAIARELLAYPANQQVDALGGGVQLALAAENPVEYSGGVVTVNLASSALGLGYRGVYTLGLALASTLCELENVRCVNVLVAGQSVSLDTGGMLPMGSVTAHPGENLPVLWEQMEARKTPVGSDAAQTPLTSYMTLYFPLDNGQGIICENRTLTFPGQTPGLMASAILEALSQGAMYLTGVTEMPDLMSQMIYEPLTSELADGGRMITLSFREGVEAEWQAAGVDPACLAAAICYSLTTFIPGTAGVAIRVGDRPMTSLRSEKFGEVPVLGGLLRRSGFGNYLMGQTTVYFIRDGRLAPAEKSVDRGRADSLRAQLAALTEGPDARERAEGLEAALPEGTGEEDVLGVALEGDAVLVNLSESFRSGIQRMGREAETLLCYSMVNTLCLNSGARRVCFFFEGEQVEYIAGTVYWAGVFDYNTGLCEESFG